MIFSKTAIAIAHKLKASIEIAHALLEVGGSEAGAYRVNEDGDDDEWVEVLATAWDVSASYLTKLYLGGMSWTRPVAPEDMMALRTERLEVELTEEEATNIRITSRLMGISTSDYIRSQLGGESDGVS